MHTIYLALKYLTRRKIAIFAICSVGLCVSLMIIITSLFNGFLDKFSDFWQYEYGQISLMPGEDVTDISAAADYLGNMPEVESARISVGSGGLLLLGRGNVKMAVVKGIDLKRELHKDQYKDGLILKDTSTDNFILSESQVELSEKWLEKKLRRKLTDADRPVNVVPCIMSVGLLADSNSESNEYDYIQMGEQLSNWKSPATLFSGSVNKTEDELSQVKRSQYYCWPINGVEVGSYHIDENTLYLPYENVIKDFNITPRILITGKPGITDTVLLEAIRTTWIDYSNNVLNQSYEDFCKTRYSVSAEEPWLKIFINEIQKQLMIMKVILGFVCLVAGVLIFVILMMVVINKKRDIGIIRATGGSRLSITSLFLNYGLSIGITGTILGLIFGFIIVNKIEVLENFLSAILGFNIWSAKSYAFSEIPDQVHIESLWWIILSGILTAGFGAVIPAYKASRIQPAESLRYE